MRSSRLAFISVATAACLLGSATLALAQTYPPPPKDKKCADTRGLNKKGTKYQDQKTFRWDEDIRVEGKPDCLFPDEDYDVTIQKGGKKGGTFSLGSDTAESDGSFIFDSTIPDQIPTGHYRLFVRGADSLRTFITQIHVKKSKTVKADKAQAEKEKDKGEKAKGKQSVGEQALGPLIAVGLLLLGLATLYLLWPARRRVAAPAVTEEGRAQQPVGASPRGSDVPRVDTSGFVPFVKDDGQDTN